MQQLQQLQQHTGPVGTAWEHRPASRDHAPQPIQSIGRSSDVNSNSVCSRCRKVLSQPEDVDLLDSGDNIEHVTQAAAAALTQLAETLSSGISSNERLASMVSLTFNIPRLFIAIRDLIRPTTNPYWWIEPRSKEDH
jgi:hypothetical protein